MEIKIPKSVLADVSIIDQDADDLTIAVINPGSTAVPVVIPPLLKGDRGPMGLPGSDGLPGRDGVDGKSAYEIAIQNGFTGSETDWLSSLKGEKGTDGINGINGRDGVDGINGSDGADGRDGVDGKSAYELAVDGGFVGTQDQWIAFLKGADGRDGIDGINGTDGQDGRDGINGTDGNDGKSAYQIAVDNGFSGSEAQWIASLKGSDGSAGLDGISGTDGKSAYELAVEAGFTGSEADWLASLKGSDGSAGADGNAGIDGKSAYQIAVEAGFTGSETDWLASLKGADGSDGNDGNAGADGSAGADGKSAYQLAVEAGFTGSESEWLASLKGADGSAGIDGNAGIDGKSAYQLAVEAGFVGSQADYLTSLKGAAGADGVGVPIGGSTGQILSKASNTDLDTVWIDAPTGTGGGTTLPTGTAGQILSVNSSGQHEFTKIKGENFDLPTSTSPLPIFSIWEEDWDTEEITQKVVAISSDTYFYLDGKGVDIVVPSYDNITEAGRKRISSDSVYSNWESCYVLTKYDIGYFEIDKDIAHFSAQGVVGYNLGGTITSHGEATHASHVVTKGQMDAAIAAIPAGGGGTTLPTGTAGQILSVNSSGQHEFTKIKGENFDLPIYVGMSKFAAFRNPSAHQTWQQVIGVAGYSNFNIDETGFDGVAPLYNEIDGRNRLYSDPVFSNFRDSAAVTEHDIGYFTETANNQITASGVAGYNSNGTITGFGDATAPEHLVRKSQMDAAIAAIPTGGGGGSNHVVLSQADYDALATKDPNTFYHITG